jgi:hypothetical protein
VESGALDKGGCEAEGGSSIGGDFERLGRSTSISWGIGAGSVASVPFAILGCSTSAAWRKSRS